MHLRDAGPVPLIEGVRGLLERTYRMRSGLHELGAFVIGDEGLRRLYAEGPARRDVGSADGSGARTLVRETPEGVRACIYFPDAMIRTLEAYPPQRGLGDRNVAAFAVFVEEIDHLLLVAERAAADRGVSLLELELHANVSKYLVLRRFLARPASGDGAAERLWLRFHLFHGVTFREPDPAVRSRYEDAGRWAIRLIDALAAYPAARRLETLRRFHDAGGQEKLSLIDAMAGTATS